MTTLGVIFLLIATLGFLALSARFLLTPAPMVHHGAVLSFDGVEVSDGHRRVFSSLYSVIGCISMSLAIMVGALALFAVPQDYLWAELVLIGTALLMSWGGVVVPRHVERETGVRMPWRPSLGVTLFMILGAIFGLF